MGPLWGPATPTVPLPAQPESGVKLSSEGSVGPSLSTGATSTPPLGPLGPDADVRALTEAGNAASATTQANTSFVIERFMIGLPSEVQGRAHDRPLHQNIIFVLRKA